MSMDQGPTTPARPRPRSRGFSFGSNRSGGSEGRQKYVESPKDKARRDSLWKGLSKANPNAAINEAQPAVAHVVEESTLANLREFQHKDSYGNQITDPDLSNPTRPRLERPLDTIKSFEKAIDDGYRRRSTYMRQDAEKWDQQNQYASRPSSYFGGEYHPSNRRQSVANRPPGYDNGPSPNHYNQSNGGGYYGNQNGYYGNRAQSSRARYGDRMQSDPQMYGQHRTYQQHGYQSSYDTVGTGASDSTGPWANSTDPSSENSSIDRVKPQTPMNGYDNYASNGYNGPIMEEQAGPSGYQDFAQPNGYGYQNGYVQRDGYGQQQNGYSQRDGYEPQPQQPQITSPRQIYARHNSAPMPPQHNAGRRPVQQLNGGYGGPPPVQAKNLPSNRREPEKRKSWLARRFSKKD